MNKYLYLTYKISGIIRLLLDVHNSIAYLLTEFNTDEARDEHIEILVVEKIKEARRSLDHILGELSK